MSNVIRKRNNERRWSPSRAAEEEYVRDLKGILDFVHRSYMNYLEPRLHMVARQDATMYTTEIEHLFATVSVAIRARVIQAFNKMAGKLDRNSIRQLSVLFGINANQLGIAHILEQFRNQNVNLVEEAGRAYAKQVRDVFDSPEAHTKRIEELQKDLVERAGVSKARAELIARDQTLKLNGQINQVRQAKAGITQYKWSTSLDSRVREGHADLEGSIQDWSNPPLVDEKTGRRAHPGQDFQCRCLAIAVIPGIDDTEGS